MEPTTPLFSGALADFARQANQDVFSGYVLPTLDDPTSDARPEPWRVFLANETTLEGDADGVQWYRVSNCNYVVVDGLVLTTFGYHGKNLFNAVKTPEGRCAFLYHRSVTQALIAELRSGTEVMESAGRAYHENPTPDTLAAMRRAVAASLPAYNAAKQHAKS